MKSVEGWTKTCLGDQLELIRNGYPGEQVAHFTDFPVSRIETISEGTINFDKVGYVDFIPDAYLLKPGDILFSNINSIKHIGKVAQVDQGMRLFHGMNLLVLRPIEQVDKKFLFYKLVSAKPWFEKMAAQAINQASINQTIIKQLLLELPQRKLEQTKIVEILSTVDQAIEQTGALIAKQERIKTGLMQDLLTRGIDEHGNLRSEETHHFKDSPLGRIPVEWEVASVSSVLSQPPRNGYSPVESSNWNGIYMLGLGCLTSEGFKPNQLKYAPKSNHRIEAALLRRGDFLISRSNTRTLVGLVGIFTGIVEPCIYPDLMVRLRFSDEVSVEYMEQVFMSSSVRRQIEMAATGTSGSMVKISASVIKGVLFMKPPLSEQMSILPILQANAALVRSMRTSLAKLRSLKTSLMQDLLTGKVRVTPLLDGTEVMSE
jgi:type I restriction enzyme S subunit